MGKWFGLVKNVEIEGGRSVWEAEQALGAVTRGLTSVREGRKKFFVGWVRGDEGKLWLCRGYNNGFALRSLRFRLLPIDGGRCRLEGKLRLSFPAQIFLGLFLVPGVIFGSQSLRYGLQHGDIHWASAFIPLVAFFLMGCFYTGLVWWHGRHSEALCLKAIKYILADERSAAVVVDLLTLGK